MSNLTATLRIEATADGLVVTAGKAKTTIRGIGDEAESTGKRSASAMGEARSAFDETQKTAAKLIATIGGIAAVKRFTSAFIEAADLQGRMEAQIRRVSRSQEEYNTVLDRTREIADSAYVSINSVSDIYVRAIAPMRQLGRTTKETLDLTEAVSLALVVSSANADGQTRAIDALSKAMQGGKMQLDGFMSLVTTAPRFVEALEASLGKSRAELMEMVSAGDMTTATLATVSSQIDILRQEANDMPTELVDAMTRLGTAFQAWAGATNAQVGFTAKLVAAVEWLTENLDEVMSAAAMLAKVLATLYGTRLLTNAALYTAALVAQAKQKIINIALARELGIAQQQGFMASLKSIGLVNAALGAAGAALAGWQIGTYLREEFIEVERFGIALVGGLLKAWERMKAGAVAAWEGTKATAIGAVNVIRKAAADLVGVLAKANEATDLFGVKSGITSKLREMEQQLRPTTSAWDGFKNGLTRVLTTLGANEQAIDATMMDLWEFAGAQREAAAATDVATDSAEAALATGVLTKEQLDALSKARTDSARTLIELAGRTSELAEAEANYKLSVMAAVDAANQQLAVGMQWAEVQEQLSATIADAKRALDEKTESIAKQKTAAEQLIDDLVFERTTIAMSNAERETAIALRRLEVGATAEQEAEIRRLIEAIHVETEAKQLSDQRTKEMAQGWQDFTGSLADAVLDGSDGVKRWWKQMIDDMKRQLIQSGLLKIFGQIFNTGGAQAGSGFGSMFAAMLGGGAQAGSAASAGGVGFGQLLQLAGAGGGTGGSLLTGLAGAISGGISTGLMSLGGGLAGLGMGGLGGGLAWAGGSIASSGLIGGLGSSFMSGIGSLGAGNMMMGLGQMLPAIGAVLAAAFAVDKISGGKLFGTKYKFDSADRTIDFSGEGVGGQDSLTEVRQRSLFRGRKWRTTNTALDAEIVGPMEDFWNAILDANSEIARTFGREAAIDVPASFKQAFDSEGKVTSEIGTILGRQYAETWEVFAQRITAENIIANIDGMLGTLAPAPGTGGGGGGGGSRRRGDDYDQLASLGGAVPLDVQARVGEASAIAERWRDDVELLAEGAQFLLLAASDIRAGVGLLGEGGTLTQITALIEELAQSGETLSGTYTRVAASAALLDQALALSGVELGKTREELVRFAVDIADVAGGLERASALWGNYFDRFYSDSERAAFALTQAQASASREFGDIGLDYANFTGEGGVAEFRRLFEEALPSLSAEAIVEWLEAAAALGIVIDATEALNTALGEAVVTAEQLASRTAILADIDSAIEDFGLTEWERRLKDIGAQQQSYIDSLVDTGMSLEDATAAAQRWGDAAREVTEAQREATYQSALSDILTPLRDELAAAGMSDFALAMRDINRWTAETTGRLHAAAVASGRQAAAEEDLTLVHQVAAQRAAAAIAQLRAAAAALVTEIFGPAEGSLDAINAQIAALEGAGGAIASGAAQAGNAIDDLFARWMRGVESVQQYLDSMLLGDLSALTPAEQLAEARRQLEETQAAALGGDADALSRLPQLSDAYLRLARGYMASGQDYNDQFAWVRELLQATLDVPPPGSPEAGAAAGGGGVAYVAPSPELQALYDQRDALLAEQEAAHRMALMEQLGDMVRELIQATGEPLEDVAASIGLNLTDLAEGLGINLNDMSAATATGLVDMARMLGVDVAELASNVGVSLGSLADRQSLLNQALDATLLDVPEDIRAQLAAPLDAIRSATNEADANAALAQLNDVTGDLPAGIRDLLAPYFDFIDPTPMTTELTRLSDIYDTANEQLSATYAANALLARIADNAMAANSAAGIPSYAVGTYNVPQTGPAILHAGEMVLPVPLARVLRDGMPAQGQAAADNREVVAELRRLGEKVERLERTTSSGAANVARTIVKTGQDSDRNADASRARHAQAQRRGVTA